MSKVYLAGPINGCTDDEASTWRDLVKARLGEQHCTDPFRRDYRGREEACVTEIVQADKADIRASTIVLANCWKPGWGTPMEIIYAYSLGIPVVAVVPAHAPVSPWVRYHAEAVFSSLDKAVAYVASHG